MTKIFVLLVLVSLTRSAFAAELSSQQQIDALHAELAASRAQIDQLKTKNVALYQELHSTIKSQNRELVGDDGLLDNNDELGLVEMIATENTGSFGNNVCEPQKWVTAQNKQGSATSCSKKAAAASNARRRTKKPTCKDTENWRGGPWWWHSCASFASNRDEFEPQSVAAQSGQVHHQNGVSWCANGRITPGAPDFFGKTFNFPERNCCVCGKGKPKNKCGGWMTKKYSWWNAPWWKKSEANALVNGKCVATDYTMEWLNQNVRLDAKAAYPAWDIGYGWGQTHKHGTSTWGAAGVLPDGWHTIGRVVCPCKNSHGQPISEETALKRIIGQMGYIGGEQLNDVWGPNLKDGQMGKANFMAKQSFISQTYMRASFATVKMLKCWKSKCAAGTGIADLQWGGGFAC